ncbi:Hypothetical protein DEACI_1125 [Acididesulfobacillus acetoxydans]|uniref:Uncharacterized protein n=1 Tax=Acididesulfobacillus acetoxydans TaxID=1561005 RepID=A0A8S0WEV5_9FIRM|nr:hypothetical protein [Acididesulfobacillus acetoxydans]CAA7600472.1 Hypothetical protein DEACI_1125 [Acididesulfobacillus acetoxydans]CEJ06606.1 Hypothetical protein DEACI_1055 [Acididesulfobacillus acetoxydans]
MAVAAVLVGFALMALIQVPPMWRKRWWRDLGVYGFIFLWALFTALSYALNWPIFSPVKTLILVMNGIYHFLGYQVPPR